MGHSFRLTSFKYLLGDGLSIMSLHRLATLSQMEKPKTLCGQWSVCLRNAKKPVCQNLKLFLTGEIRLLREWIPAWHSPWWDVDAVRYFRCQSLFYNQVTHCVVICVRWPKGKMALYYGMEISYDLFWFVWGPILPELVKHSPQKENFFCLTNSPFKYHHILLGKIQYNY